MCGITGQYNFSSGEPVHRSTIAQMAETIIHRGPDDEGIFLSGPLGLGFRRLSIIDLSAGHQPMSDAQEKVWVVFNGEIYNFRELRQELESHGHAFRTASDTEVIVHGYKQWGDGVLNRLNGMFGLAIWDDQRRRLLVARDPMGIKPVYYSLAGGVLRFGSEIRPVLRSLPSRPALDGRAMLLFLRYRYTPAPYTLHEGVRKLAAGECIVVENEKARVQRYYTFAPQPFAKQPSDDEARERLLELYKAAVKRHLISDVPVGLLLSGGMDSGLLLGLMKQFGAEWPTFTVGYGSSYRDDELVDARETAQIYSSKHTSVLLDREQFEAALPRIVRVLEEPVATSSIVPMYFVCERARADVKVALLGQGPDELMGGYIRHLGVRYGGAWRQLPRAARRALGAAVEALPRNESLKRGIHALAVPDRMRRYQEVFALEPGTTVSSLFRNDQLPASASDALLACWAPIVPQLESLDELGGLQLLELRSSLPDELLMYGDKMSMVHGLEARVPYLDREVVEYVQQLGSKFKVRRGVRKWLHRQVCRDFLPPAILNRKKRGFGVNVVDDWMRETVGSKHSSYLHDPKSLVYQYLEPHAVHRLVHAHREGRHNHHKLLFSLTILEEWLRCNADTALPPARKEQFSWNQG